MGKEQSYENANLAALKDIIGPVESFAADNGFYVSMSVLNGHREIIPAKFNGVVFCICREGRFTITLNDNEFNVSPNTIFAVPTNLTAGLDSVEGGDPAKILTIAISGKYFFDLKIDIGDVLKQMRFDGLTERRVAPFTRIEESECTILEEHIRLICRLFNSNVRDKKDNYTLLMSSTVNVLYKAVTDKMRTPQRVRVTTSKDSARAKSAFTEFMNLAVANFERERGISFYANEMCLTPKYLSKLVKENCGRTASEIIDSMVIAKTNNLLKHSDKSVKVIASEMGFSSQSAFNKFFKAKTGMSPLQFRAE